MRRKHIQARKARRALAWGVVLFALLQLGLAAGIEWYWPHFRDPDYAYKLARLQKRLADKHDGRPPLLVLMLGSSRTAYGFRSSMIEDRLESQLDRRVVVFNLGFFGAGPVCHHLMLQRLLDDGVRPDLLLVEVFPSFLNEAWGPKMEKIRLGSDRLWLRDVKRMEEVGLDGAALRREWWQSWPVPAYTHRFAILNDLAPKFLWGMLRSDWGRTPDPTGWVAIMFDRSLQAIAVENARKSFSRYYHKYRLGGVSCTALRALVARCRQEEIPLALVLMPEGSAFRSLYSPRVQHQLWPWLEQLQRESGVALVNAQCWVPDELFSDSHHLLPEGADVFTRRLEREVLSPTLRRLFPPPVRNQ